MSECPSSCRDLERIIESDRRCGVDLGVAEAAERLSAMVAEGGGAVVDTLAGVFGHRIGMLDFSLQERPMPAPTIPNCLGSHRAAS